MKRSPSMLSCCAVLFFALSGCGAAGDESPHSASPQLSAAAVAPTSRAAAATTTPGEQDASPPESGAGGTTDPTAFGKRCNASCSVVSVGATSCPPNIGGFGNTTFLGGCNKACRKAEGDAASKLPAGCVINTCSFSGC